MDEQPFLIPITDRAAYLARVHIGVTIPLLALCLVPFSARLYIRAWPIWRFGWDDALIVAGLALAIADWVLVLGEMFTSPQLITVSRATNATMLAYIAIPVWGLAMTCIKASVALTLLRLPLDRMWIISLRVILVVLVVYLVGDTVYIFTKCRPLQASWDFTVVNPQCTDPHTDVIVSSIATAVNITTDVLLSLAPMITLWNVRRPLRERVLVCILTGLGLFASLISILKAVLVMSWGDRNVEDPWALAVSISTYTIGEQFLALLAACSPSLKGPIQKLLRKFGILLTRYETNISFVHISPTRRRRIDAESGISSGQYDVIADGGTSGKPSRAASTSGEASTSTSSSAASGQDDALKRPDIITNHVS